MTASFPFWVRALGSVPASWALVRCSSFLDQADTAGAQQLGDELRTVEQFFVY